MTLEAFAQAHSLPPRWLELRRRCEDMVRQPDFWYRTDLRQQASELAIQASNILNSTLSETALQEHDQAEQPDNPHTLPTEMPI
ncbi:MAG TPA: hypothetical protein VGS27_05705 [Candidatus Sulfotelmatobacter sp.]|nr:hypothetical protein [Candidatus Sulfotelmatobacter sp.]